MARRTFETGLQLYCEVPKCIKRSDTISIATTRARLLGTGSHARLGERLFVSMAAAPAPLPPRPAAATRVHA